MRMIELVEQGQIGTVIVKDLSRMGRNYLQTGYYTEVIFPEHDVRFIAINDNVDSDKGENEFAPIKNLMKRDIPFKTIKGEVSSPINVKPGCRFCKRCEFASAACEGTDKPLVEATPGHFVACELHK